MSRARFEIGTNEKHTIEATASGWTSKVRIWVDGREITNTFKIGLANKSFKFQVGNTERHEIEIKIGGTKTKFEFFNDGIIVGSA
jgi:head-tail adaptor